LSQPGEHIFSHKPSLLGNILPRASIPVYRYLFDN
jgi:hypothetical protein